MIRKNKLREAYNTLLKFLNESEEFANGVDFTVIKELKQSIGATWSEMLTAIVSLMERKKVYLTVKGATLGEMKLVIIKENET